MILFKIFTILISFGLKSAYDPDSTEFTHMDNRNWQEKDKQTDTITEPETDVTTDS